MNPQRASLSRIAGAIDVVVIGAGHAGLAISHVLGEQGVDYVVLERGDVANSWRRERWDSLRLLTPNWQTRLPGKAYDGHDPDGFMSGPELVGFLEDYAAEGSTPVMTNTNVTSVHPYQDGYRVVSNRGIWSAKAVVIASGACNQPSVPRVADNFPELVEQLTPFDYTSPKDVPEGRVLIVGASATGLQMARELREAGHEVTVAAGEHVRMPRKYRGKDIFYWLKRSGIHDQRYDEVEDIARGRRLPSPQLVGSNELPLLDLNYLMEQGVDLVGRLMGVRDDQLQFSGSLGNVCALADLKMNRLLRQIDEYADQEGAPAAELFEATRVPERPPLTLGIGQANIRSVIWATGFRPDYSWLNVPVLNHKGQLRHEGGVVEAPGLYALGLPLMRRRKSSFIFGIEDDARDIANHLMGYLTTNARRTSDDLHQDNAGEPSFRRSA